MDFRESPSGKVIKAFTGYYSFIPNPLPPQFKWDTSVVSSLSRADHVLGMLSREGEKVPNPRRSRSR